MQLQFPYGKRFLPLDVPDDRLQGVLTSGLHGYVPVADQYELVERALAEPIGTPPLCELARGKRRIVLLASDHTRPVPSRAIIPPMLRELRRGSPDADITILIATGCHRGRRGRNCAPSLARRLWRGRRSSCTTATRRTL